MIEYEGHLHQDLQQAIIKRDVFDRVQETLMQNSHIKKDLKRCKLNSILQGLLRFAACNCGMSHSYTKKGSTVYHYYVCRKSQKQGWASCPSPSLPAEIEDFVSDQIRCVGQDPGVVRDTLAQSRVQTQTTVEQLKKEKSGKRTAKTIVEAGTHPEQPAPVRFPCTTKKMADAPDIQGRFIHLNPTCNEREAIT